MDAEGDAGKGATNVGGGQILNANGLAGATATTAGGVENAGSILAKRMQEVREKVREKNAKRREGLRLVRKKQWETRALAKSSQEQEEETPNIMTDFNKIGELVKLEKDRMEREQERKRAKRAANRWKKGLVLCAEGNRAKNNATSSRTLKLVQDAAFSLLMDSIVKAVQNRTKGENGNKRKVKGGESGYDVTREGVQFNADALIRQKSTADEESPISKSRKIVRRRSSASRSSSTTSTSTGSIGTTSTSTGACNKRRRQRRSRNTSPTLRSEDQSNNKKTEGLARRGSRTTLKAGCTAKHPSQKRESSQSKSNMKSGGKAGTRAESCGLDAWDSAVDLANSTADLAGSPVDLCSGESIGFASDDHGESTVKVSASTDDGVREILELMNQQVGETADATKSGGDGGGCAQAYVKGSSPKRMLAVNEVGSVGGSGDPRVSSRSSKITMVPSISAATAYLRKRESSSHGSTKMQSISNLQESSRAADREPPNGIIFKGRRASTIELRAISGSRNNTEGRNTAEERDMEVVKVARLSTAQERKKRQARRVRCRVSRKKKHGDDKGVMVTPVEFAGGECTVVALDLDRGNLHVYHMKKGSKRQRHQSVPLFKVSASVARRDPGIVVLRQSGHYLATIGQGAWREVFGQASAHRKRAKATFGSKTAPVASGCYNREEEERGSNDSLNRSHRQLDASFMEEALSTRSNYNRGLYRSLVPVSPQRFFKTVASVAGSTGSSFESYDTGYDVSFDSAPNEWSSDEVGGGWRSSGAAEGLTNFTNTKAVAAEGRFALESVCSRLPKPTPPSYAAPSRDKVPWRATICPGGVNSISTRTCSYPLRSSVPPENNSNTKEESPPVVFFARKEQQEPTSNQEPSKPIFVTAVHTFARRENVATITAAATVASCPSVTTPRQQEQEQERHHHENITGIAISGYNQPSIIQQDIKSGSEGRSLQCQENLQSGNKSEDRILTQSQEDEHTGPPFFSSTAVAVSVEAASSCQVHPIEIAENSQAVSNKSIRRVSPPPTGGFFHTKRPYMRRVPSYHGDGRNSDTHARFRGISDRAKAIHNRAEGRGIAGNSRGGRSLFFLPKASTTFMSKAVRIRRVLAARVDNNSDVNLKAAIQGRRQWRKLKTAREVAGTLLHASRFGRNHSEGSNSEEERKANKEGYRREDNPSRNSSSIWSEGSWSSLSESSWSGESLNEKEELVPDRNSLNIDDGQAIEYYSTSSGSTSSSSTSSSSTSSTSTSASASTGTGTGTGGDTSNSRRRSKKGTYDNVDGKKGTRRAFGSTQHRKLLTGSELAASGEKATVKMSILLVGQQDQGLLNGLGDLFVKVNKNTDVRVALDTPGALQTVQLMPPSLVVVAWSALSNTKAAREFLGSGARGMRGVKSGIPVAIVGGKNDGEGLRIELENLGASAVLLWPYEPENVQDLLQKYLPTQPG